MTKSSKLLLSFILAASALLLGSVLAPMPVLAADDYPYPNPNIPSCSMGGPCVPDPWGWFERECTSYVAWRMNRDHGTTGSSPYFTNTMINGQYFGNAQNWDDKARNVGFSVTTTPRKGAVALWEAYSGEAGPVGHVAYVESVNSDGSVNISEYNWNNGDGKYNTRANVRADKYIHINNVLIPNPTPRNESFVSATSVTFDWDAVPGVQKYVVRIGDQDIDTTATHLVRARGDLPEENVVTSWSVRGIYPGGFSTDWTTHKYGFFPTGDSSTAIIGTRVVQSVTAKDAAVYTRYKAVGGTTWSPFVYSNGKATGAPALIYFKNKIVQVIRGTKGNAYTRYSTNGKTWSGFVNRGGALNTAPVLVKFGKRLYFFTQGADKYIYYKSSLDGINWDSSYRNVGMRGLSTPSVAVFGGKLVVAMRGLNDEVLVGTSADGSAWSTFKQINSGETVSAVKLQVFNSRLHLSIIGSSGTVYTANSADLVTWSAYKTLGTGATGNTTFLVFKGQLLQAYRSTDRKIYITMTLDGINWKTPLNISGELRSDVHLATDGTYLIATILGGNPSKLYSTQSLSWKVWPAWVTVLQ